VETKIKQGYRFVAAVYHRPTERLEPLPPPPEIIRTAADSTRRWRPALILSMLAAIAVWGLLGGWLIARRSSPATPVVVVSLTMPAVHDAAAAAHTGHAVQREVFAALAQLDGITVAADRSAVNGRNGLAVELSCRNGRTGTIELDVVLRRLASGETLWGWSWSASAGADDAPGLAVEVSERVVSAVSSRVAD
jgi:hypothetical protein